MIWVGYGRLLLVGAAGLYVDAVLALDPDPAEIGGFRLFDLVCAGVLGARPGAGMLQTAGDPRVTR